MVALAALIGRDDVLDRVAQALGRDAGGVLLVGELGVGKTRLAVACLDLAGEAGRTTARVTATRSAAAIPFGAVAPLLPPITRGDHVELLARAAAHVRGLGGAAPPIVLVDDAHLLDDGSAALVHHLVATGSAFVVATVRTDAVPPDPVLALSKDGLVERVDLTPLDLAETQALAESLVGGLLLPAAARELYAATNGNPLFLTEVVLAALQSGAISREGMGWGITADLPPTPELIAAVESRLGDLAESDRHLLDTVALGEPLDIDLLERLGGPDASQRIERLERDGFLLADAGPTTVLVRLTHPLYSDVLRRTAPRTWARRVLTDLADTLDARGTQTPDDVLRLATWRLEAGVPPAPELAAHAALLASLRRDHDLAERLAYAAVKDGADFEGSIALAQVRLNAGSQDGLDILDEIERGELTDAQRGRVAVIRFDTLAYLHGQYLDAMRAAVEAELAMEDPSWKAELAARRALLFQSGGWSTIALGTLEPHLGHELSARSTAWVFMVLSYVESSTGDLERGLRAADEGERASIGLPDDMTFFDPTLFLMTRALLLARGGDPQEGARILERALAGYTSRATQARGWLLWASAVAYNLAGRPQTAAVCAADAAALFDGVGADGLSAIARSELALAAAVLHDEATLDEALAGIEALGASAPVPIRGEQARAWQVATHGDRTRATEMLRTLGERCRDNSPVDALLVAVDLLELGDPAGANAVAHAVEDRVHSPLAVVVLAAVDAAAAEDGAGLDRASEQMVALGMLSAGSLLAQLAGGAHAAAGSRVAATESRRRATEIAARTERPANGTGTDDVLASLSQRQRDVVTLAARGLSNQEIATRLDRSRRTIESQLQAAYDRLGVRNREDLAALLGRTNR